MSHFYAGLREWISSEAKQKPGSSSREFPSLRFSEPESFHPATGVSPEYNQAKTTFAWTKTL